MNKMGICILCKQSQEHEAGQEQDDDRDHCSSDRGQQQAGNLLRAFFLGHIAEGHDEGNIIVYLYPQLSRVRAVVEVSLLTKTAYIYIFVQRLFIVDLQRRE